MSVPNLFASPRRQLLSLPPNIIYSILQNPSSHKGLTKLYQTCKYFYSKRPILVADDVKFRMNSDEPIVASQLYRIFVEERDVSHLRIPIWLTNEIYFERDCKFSLHRIPNNFYRYSIKKIAMEGGTLQYEDFVLLTSEKMIQKFETNFGSFIYHSDGSRATIEELLRHLPNIRSFDSYIDETCSIEVITKLNDIKFNNKFEHFLLRVDDVSSTFDLNLFSEFIMKNSNDKTCVCIYLGSGETTVEKLKIALAKLVLKWKNAACKGLKEFFIQIDPDWKA